MNLFHCSTFYNQFLFVVFSVSVYKCLFVIFVEEVLDVILDLAAQGRTMIIVTHEMQFARAVADRIIFLEGGKIQEDETPDEFFEHPKTDRAKKFLNTFTFESVKRDI